MAGPGGRMMGRYLTDEEKANQPKVTIPFDVGFDDIYIVVREVDLQSLILQESEVQAVRWAEEAEIRNG